MILELKKQEGYTIVWKGQMETPSSFDYDFVEDEDLPEVAIVKVGTRDAKYYLIADIMSIVVQDKNAKVVANFIGETTAEHYAQHAPKLSWRMPNGNDAIIIA